MYPPIDQIDKMTDNLMKVCSDTNIMVRNAMNAALQSASILTKGCEEMGDSISVLLQKSLQDAAKASRVLVNAKSVHDIMEVQSGLMKGAFDNMLAEMNKMTQLSSRIMQQASEPVTQHVNATMTKLSLVKAA